MRSVVLPSWVLPTMGGYRVQLQTRSVADPANLRVVALIGGLLFIPIGLGAYLAFREPMALFGAGALAWVLGGAIALYLSDFWQGVAAEALVVEPDRVHVVRELQPDATLSFTGLTVDIELDFLVFAQGPRRLRVRVPETVRRDWLCRDLTGRITFAGGTADVSSALSALGDDITPVMQPGRGPHLPDR